MVIMLIGNKSDLDSRRQVSQAEGQAFADEHGLIFMETSAKTAHNVEESFLKTSEMIYENIDKGVYDLSNDKSGIRVGNESYQIQGSTRLEAAASSKAAGAKGGCC